LKSATIFSSRPPSGCASPCQNSTWTRACAPVAEREGR
jgi:hypothetical protein